jgi:hypothetical protein
MPMTCYWRGSPRCICAFPICRTTPRANAWKRKTASSNLHSNNAPPKSAIRDGIRRCIRAPARRPIPAGSRRRTARRVTTHLAQTLQRTRRRHSAPMLRQSPPDDRVKLPPSDDDIDELHDLVEWIANAKPEDEAVIRGEIKKHFYDAGDTAGGNALSDALEAGNNKKARQEILDSIADFAKNDPAIIGFIRESLPLLAIPGAGPGRAASEGTAVEAETGAAAAEAAAENPWKMGWASRGKYFDKVYGKGTLNSLSRTIDDFEAGIATSRKSIDLNAATYQDFGRSHLHIEKRDRLRADHRKNRGRILYASGACSRCSGGQYRCVVACVP